MNSADRQIRFAVLCTGTVFPAWQAQSIKQLVDHPQIQLVLLIKASSGQGKQSDLGLQMQKTSSGKLLWHWFYKNHVQKKAKAYKTEDLSRFLAKVPSIAYQLSGPAKNLEAIRDQQLDFVLQFGGATSPEALLDIAKFGVWSFHHGDDLTFNGTPPCFWEIYQGQLVTGASLQRLTDDPQKKVILKRGFLKTKISYPKNIDQIFFESARWPVQACIDILHNQLDRLEAAPSRSDVLEFTTPTSLEMISFFGRLVRLTVKKAFKSLFYTDFWNIGVAEVPIQRFLDTASPPAVKWFPNLPKSKFIADPFGIKQDDKLHIVYEDFLFKEGVGTIGTLEYNQDGFSEERIEINEPFHLSYPFTFEYENEIYAIPESYQAKQVRLYKSLDFPHKWVFDRVLIDGYAGIDNTLFSHDGYWWMFSTDKDDGVHYNLKIHYAEDPFGTWYPHPKNPVKTDIRSARPAGSIFSHEGAVFRPSMDYSEKIEGRITINKIITLSTTDFEEEVHGILNPFPNTFYSDKVHTLCAAENFTIVDGAKELFIFNNIHVFRYQFNKQWNKIARRMGFT